MIIFDLLHCGPWFNNDISIHGRVRGRNRASFFWPRWLQRSAVEIIKKVGHVTPSRDQANERQWALLTPLRQSCASRASNCSHSLSLSLWSMPCCGGKATAKWRMPSRLAQEITVSYIRDREVWRGIYVNWNVPSFIVTQKREKDGEQEKTSVWKQQVLFCLLILGQHPHRLYVHGKWTVLTKPECTLPHVLGLAHHILRYSCELWPDGFDHA